MRLDLLEEPIVNATIETEGTESSATITLTQDSVDGRYVQKIYLTPEGAVKLAAAMDAVARATLSAMTAFADFSR